MNEYLKEIAVLCGIDVELNTHKARRTFGRTVTLNNDVQIHAVKSCWTTNPLDEQKNTRLAKN